MAAEAHLRTLRENRRGYRSVVYDSTKRVMSLVKARFGDDSIAYKLLGGVPISERARPKRQQAPRLEPASV